MASEKDAETIGSDSTTTVAGEKQGDVEKGPSNSMNPSIPGEKQTDGGVRKPPLGGEETPAVPPPVTFPDGGFVAWSQVAMGFLIMFSTW